MTTENPNPTPNDPPADDTALGTAATGEDKADTKADETVTDDKTADTDKAADAKADTAKGEDKAAAAEGAPESYDVTAFKMPEGVEFDKEGFEAVEPVLKELNLTQDQAGKLMGAYAEKIVPMIQQRTIAAQDDAAAELRANLARDLQADPEVGGKKLNESQALAAKAIAAAIPDAKARSEFSTFLNESGLGNHPLLMRVIANAGRSLSEASTPAADHSSAPLSESQKFYG